MNAVFVEVSAARFVSVLAEPDQAEALFDGTHLPGSHAGGATTAIAANRLARMVTGVDPNLQQRLATGLGLSVDAVRRGDEAAVAALADLLQGPGAPRGRGGMSPPDAVLSIEKAWHGLHYLLTGTADLPGPASDAGAAVLGGVEIGDDFGGYGPARAHEPAAVASIVHALGAPTVQADAEARYDAAAMNAGGVYPGGWDTPGSGGLPWLLSALASLRDFYTVAASHDAGIITRLL